MKNVLIAISGMTPAVITETVWALATQKHPVIPDKVVVLTTSGGKEKLLTAFVFENGLPSAKGPWGALVKELAAKKLDVKNRLVFTEQTVKVFTGEDECPLDDLRTRSDNLMAANLMMKVVREYTDDDDWVVHAQLAGGRKTMSALFFSCLCLLGRPCDHVYHVLVSDGYDRPGLEPMFFFPQKGIVHTCKDRDGKTLEYPSVKGKVELFDVPFVPMGEWAEQKCKAKRKHLNYENIIASVNAGIGDEVFPKVEVDLSGRGTVVLNGKPVKLSHYEFALFVFVIQGRCAEGCLAPMRELKDFLCLSDEIDLDVAWLQNYMGDETKRDGQSKFGWYKDKDREKKIAHDLSSTLNTLRGKLPQTSCMDRLVNRSSFPSDFDVAKVLWHGYENLPEELLSLLFFPETRKRLAWGPWQD